MARQDAILYPGMFIMNSPPCELRSRTVKLLPSEIQSHIDVLSETNKTNYNDRSTDKIRT